MDNKLAATFEAHSAMYKLFFFLRVIFFFSFLAEENILLHAKDFKRMYNLAQQLRLRLSLAFHKRLLTA